MAWVIAGPYPPTADPAAARTLAFAKDRLRAGDAVLVVSPVPSAAHRHEHLLGVRGIRTIRRACRGADGLYLTLQPHVGLTPGAGRARSLAERGLLALVLRSVPRTVLDLDDPRELTDRRGGRVVLEAASELVVNDDETRSRLVSVGAAPAKIRVVPSGDSRGWHRGDVASVNAPATPRAVAAPVIPSDADRGVIEKVIRERAAALSPTTMRRPSAGVDSAAAVRALPPLALPVPPKTAKGRVAQVVSRFTAWQIRPVVDQVNQLQRAVIEAVDAPRSQASGDQPPD